MIGPKVWNNLIQISQNNAQSYQDQSLETADTHIIHIISNVGC